MFYIYIAFHENLTEILTSISEKRSIINAKKETEAILAETKAILWQALTISNLLKA